MSHLVQTIKRITKKAIVAIRQDGLRSTMFWFFFGFFKPNTFYLFKNDLLEWHPSDHRTRDFKIRVMTRDNLSAIRGDLKLPREWYMDDVHGIRYCVVATVNERPAHITWIYLKGDPSRFFTLKDREAELNYSHTVQEFRGKGIYTMVLMEACRWLKENSCHVVYDVAHSANIPAIKAVQKLGFKKIAEVTHYGFIRPRFHYVS